MFKRIDGLRALDRDGRGTEASQPPRVVASTMRSDIRGEISNSLRDRAAVTFVDTIAELASAAARVGPALGVLYLDGSYDRQHSESWCADLRRFGQIALGLPIISAVTETGAGFRQYLAGRPYVGELHIYPRESLAQTFDKVIRAQSGIIAIDTVLEHLLIASGPRFKGVATIVRASIEGAHRGFHVEHLANRVGLSPRTIAYRLAALGFPSPESMIMWGRVFALGWRLQNPQMSIAHAARALGYLDSHEVHDLVKRYVGSHIRTLRSGKILTSVTDAFLLSLATKIPRGCRVSDHVARSLTSRSAAPGQS
jgi:AraC-like DNA-binding protein